jgi:hypothetical protein
MIENEYKYKRTLFERGLDMGFFDSLFKAFGKELAKEAAKSPQQRNFEKLERDLGIPLDPSSYREFKTEAEYHEFVRQEQELEQAIIDRLYEAAEKIVDKVWAYQDDYIARRIGKGKFTEELERGLEDLGREIITAKAIDPKGYISIVDKKRIYESHKKNLDYIKFTWLPKN